MILLDNSMFNDGSLDCFNFGVSTQDGCSVYDGSDIIRTLGLVNEVTQAIKDGKRYLDTSKMELVYCCDTILEITWG